jgi:exopolysaccharide production protein ExoZ
MLNPPAPVTLSTLQAYRALAALLVVAGHAQYSASRYFSIGSLWFMHPWGNAGVAFFFCLSGFVMAWVHAPDAGHPSRAPAYLARRLTRVYPVYWFVNLLLLPFWFLGPSVWMPYHAEPIAFVKSLLLLPQVHSPHLAVAWTLIHEMLFYLLFGVLFLSRVAGIVVLVVWAAAIIMFGWDARGVWTGLILSPLNLLFPLGMLAALAARRLAWLRGRGGLAAFLLGNALFIPAFLMGDGALREVHPALALGPGAFLILAGAAGVVPERFFGRRRVLLFLGAASYSLYLIHYPALSLAGKVLSAAPLPGMLGLALSVALALGAGCLLHLAVEKPLLKRLRRSHRTHPAQRM